MKLTSTRLVLISILLAGLVLVFFGTYRTRLSLTAGFEPRFMSGPRDYRALGGAYGFQFPTPLREVAPENRLSALREGRIGVTTGLAADRRIESMNLAPLKDNRRFFPADFIAPVLRRRTQELHPALPDALEQLALKLSDRLVLADLHETCTTARSLAELTSGPGTAQTDYLDQALRCFLVKHELIGERAERERPRGEIAVGAWRNSRTTPQNAALARVCVVLLRSRAGLDARLRLFAGRGQCLAAVEKGEVDLYLERAGAALADTADTAPPYTQEEARAALDRLVSERGGRVLLSGFEPINASSLTTLITTEELAEEADLYSISSLARTQQNMFLGFFRKLGPDIAKTTFEHLLLTVIALGVAVIISVPLGIYLTRTRFPQLAAGVLGVAGVIQTIPTLAMIAFIVLFFLVIHMVFGLRLPYIGFTPGVVALTLYAFLPILRNTYTGIRQVDPAIIEVATGMGMRPRQILWRVELPLSLPVIMAGVRIATVWTIGIATLCGLIGAGGLGELIFKGLRSMPRTADYLGAGTVPAAALALCLDYLLGLVEDWLTPLGLKSRRPET